MTTRVSASNSCLCGKVTITVERLSTHMDACHCTMCRKWSGGPYFSLNTRDIQITGQEHVQVYPSSEWAERAFCKSCGTHLYYHLKGEPMYALTAGFFQDLESIDFAEEIFVDQQPSYYEFANQTERLSGAQTIARFAASLDKG